MIKNLIVIIAIAGFLASCGGTGETKDDAKTKRIEMVNKRIKFYRDSMKAAGVDHLSFYSIDYVSHTAKDTTKTDSVAIDSTITVLSLADFDAKAGEYVGKKIKVSGIVDHVCKHGGKKILLVADGVKTHVMKPEGRFDDKLNGSKIDVVGIVTEERIDEAYLQKLKKEAEESKGEAKKGSKHEDEDHDDNKN